MPYWKTWVMTFLLVALALFSPVVLGSLAQVLTPFRGHSIDIENDPPIRFYAGPDYKVGERAGITSDFVAGHADGSYVVTVNGYAGATIEIDRLLRVEKDHRVALYKLSIADGMGGTLEPEVAKMRLWAGPSPPVSDLDPRVCAVLDLTAPEETESDGPGCIAPVVHAQFILRLAPEQQSAASGVTVRPTGIQVT